MHTETREYDVPPVHEPAIFSLTANRAEKVHCGTRTFCSTLERKTRVPERSSYKSQEVATPA